MQQALIALAIAAAFLVGSIPFGYMMGRARGVDLRKHGSGNTGATNVFRTLGKGWGLACLALDIFKGWLPVTLLAGLAAAEAQGWPPGLWPWLVGLAAIAGHMFSPFLGFRGGKGVATSLGVLLAIAWLPVLITTVMGLIIIALTRYVSLASIIGAATLPFLILILQWREGPWISFGITLVLGLVIIWKHRSNLARLRSGTEKKVFSGSKAG